MTPERIELRVGPEDFIVLTRLCGIDSVLFEPRIEDAVNSIRKMLRPEWDNRGARC